MSERPILFKGEMVRAILAGRKTQTRRVVKPQPPTYLTAGREPWNIADNLWGFAAPGDVRVCRSENTLRCPYGQPGDRLWVRETFQVYSYCPGEYGGQGEAGYPLRQLTPAPADGTYCVEHAADGGDGPFRPSIHMPRWASRLTLEITGVRVERLQDICEEDAEAEGVSEWGHTSEKTLDAWCRTTRKLDRSAGGPTMRGGFCALWDSINGDTYPWDSNPWLWVVEFRKLEVQDA